MNKLSLVSLAAAAACSGAPVIQQSAPTVPESDPKTEAEVATALETAGFIRDKCMGMLSDGEISFGVEERGEKVITTLRITKGSQNGDAITEETCECVYRIDIPTFVHEQRFCNYKYDIRDGKLETEHIGINKISHTEKSDGRSFTSLNISTVETDREPVSVDSRFTTEISADGRGCRTFDENTDTPDRNRTLPFHDSAKLGSCEYFTNVIDIFVSMIKDSICGQLKQDGATDDDLPPLCSSNNVFWAPYEPVPTPQTPLPEVPESN